MPRYKRTNLTLNPGLHEAVLPKAKDMGMDFSDYVCRLLIREQGVENSMVYAVPRVWPIARNKATAHSASAE